MTKITVLLLLLLPFLSVNAHAETVDLIRNATSGVTVVDGIANVGKISTRIELASVPVKDVPIPAAAWLFGTAILGFIAYSARRRV